MADKNGRGLGKRLGAMIDTDLDVARVTGASRVTEEEMRTALEVKLRDVEPNRNQPRTNFDEEELAELAESIRQYGVITPLIVVKRDSHYMIIAGERRWRAAKLAGLKEVPVVVRDYTEQEIAEISLIENLQRSDLSPLEEAEAYSRLMKDYGLTQEQLAEHVSKSRPVIANSLRLLKLPEEVRRLLEEKKLTTGHAKAILGLESAEKQVEMARLIAEKGLTVREAEEYIRRTSGKNQKEKTVLSNGTAYQDAENTLKEKLGTKVRIRRSKENAGKIEIDFYSLDDIERILRHMI